MNLRQLVRAGFNTRQAQAVLAQAGPPKLSTSKMAFANAPGGQVIAPHDFGIAISWAGAAIAKGEDYWGVPGSALPLDISVLGNQLRVPEDDCCYDVVVSFNANADPADAGKLVSIRAYGDNSGTKTWVPVEATGAINYTTSFSDQVFLGDAPCAVGIDVVTVNLTEDIVVAGATMLFVKR